jgi:septum formation protein
MKIILSSNSPRRRELLAGLGIDFEVKVIEGVDESYPDTLPSKDVAEYIAREKAAAYEVADDELVITADTVVIVGDDILGKPHDAAEAHVMLRKISGRTHHVVTGVCMKTKREQHSFSVVTGVPMCKEEIREYIATGEPMDKAGAYGIQEWIGYIGVTGLDGSYYNVMGFPVQRVYAELTNRFKIVQY